MHPIIENELKTAVEHSDEERCGFLFGVEEEDKRIITETMVVENISPLNRKKTFEISADDYIRAEKYSEENNLRLLGIFHSHINYPAIPSEYDRVAAQPYFSYVILSAINKRVDSIRSWRINDNIQFEEEQLSITNINHQHINGYRDHPNSAA